MKWYYIAVEQIVKKNKVKKSKQEMIVSLLGFFYVVYHNFFKQAYITLETKKFFKGGNNHV